MRNNWRLKCLFVLLDDVIMSTIYECSVYHWHKSAVFPGVSFRPIMVFSIKHNSVKIRNLSNNDEASPSFSGNIEIRKFSHVQNVNHLSPLFDTWQILRMSHRFQNQTLVTSYTIEVYPFCYYESYRGLIMEGS